MAGADPAGRFTDYYRAWLDQLADDTHWAHCWRVPRMGEAFVARAFHALRLQATETAW